METRLFDELNLSFVAIHILGDPGGSGWELRG